MSGIEPTYVETPSGRMHVVTKNGHLDGPCLVLLHQTPRSWDEFRAVADLLDGYRLVIPDLPGYGGSEPLRDNTIEATAAAVLGVLDALRVPYAHLVGHHFGGLVAYHLAVSAPERVLSLVLSSTPFIDAAERDRRRDAPPFNHFPATADGEHLAQLWRRRSEYLAHPDPEVQSRYVRDVLAQPDPDRGHAAVAAYRSEDGVGRYGGQVLCLASARDPRAFPRRAQILAAFPQATEHVLAEGDISSPETCPGEFAQAVLDFHTGLVLR
ncbi:alpha/beta fold hydrolase [Mycobacterium sp. ITM-2016-00317]|uniref:alpha/beta fold hydrolase n=1 Tax=Mycobacterium sp. ITM-2016-00317 TaxID=2099694 RepID=UPI000D440FCC|nr:alpha/beta hydrolase [Mycobacterium sp. ITM-2016-00317]WNG90172.1 alpha/beta fold hydrolase [Mycobacterium sp. ITM-2016-00317]